MEEVAQFVTAVQKITKSVGELGPYWIVREQTFRLCCEAEEKIAKRGKDVAIARITSSSVSIVSSGLAVAGVLLTPFTFGISLGLTVAGVTGAVTTAATNIGASAIGAKLQKQDLEVFLTQLMLYETERKFLEETLNVSVSELIDTVVPDYGEVKLQHLREICRNIRKGVSAVENIFGGDLKLLILSAASGNPTALLKLLKGDFKEIILDIAEVMMAIKEMVQFCDTETVHEGLMVARAASGVASGVIAGVSVSGSRIAADVVEVGVSGAARVAATGVKAAGVSLSVVGVGFDIADIVLAAQVLKGQSQSAYLEKIRQIMAHLDMSHTGKYADMLRQRIRSLVEEGRRLRKRIQSESISDDQKNKLNSSLRQLEWCLQQLDAFKKDTSENIHQ